ncbi:MAG: amidohydrolase family protein, partial [Gemmatimonadota bacterium]|nr:amidohydrolase family protein [Gemmatimonadota bacterium]
GGGRAAPLPDAGAPPERVTISSDGGGCLPVFDGDGRIASMDVGDPGALAGTLAALLAMDQPLERVLPAFTANPARLLRLRRKGTLDVGQDADLVVLDDNGGVTDVMANGAWHVVDGRVVRGGTFEAAGAQA